MNPRISTARMIATTRSRTGSPTTSTTRLLDLTFPHSHCWLSLNAETFFDSSVAKSMIRNLSEAACYRNWPRSW